jgi:hypothetical protein
MRACALALALAVLLKAGLMWDVSAADPADASSPVPRLQYESVLAGTRSYRPVEPMPWGDVNRRVAPPGALAPPAPGSKQHTEPGKGQGDAPERGGHRGH